MRRWLVLLVFLFLPRLARGQGIPFAVTPPAPGALVSVCNFPAIGNPCTNTATISGSVTLSPALAQPFLIGAGGNFLFYVAAGTYQIQITGRPDAVVSIGGGIGLADPGGNGIVNRTALNTTAPITTSAGLAAVISDKTGTGAAVFANTPTLISPAIGAATGASLTLTGALQAASLAAGGAAVTSLVPGTGIRGCIESSVTGTPTAGQDYEHCDQTTHHFLCSWNGAADVPCDPAIPASWTAGHAISAGTWPALVDSGVAPIGASPFAARTDGATVTWAIANAASANASLLFTVHSGSRTLNITNPVNGGSYVLELTQDATGGEGLILGTGCVWKVRGGGSGAVTLSTAASAIDVLSFTFDGTNCLANLSQNLN